MKWSKWGELRDKVANLSLRERGILTGTVVALIVFVWLQFFFVPVEKMQAHHAKTLASLDQQIVNQSNRVVELTELLAHNPNEPLWAEQKQLQEQMVQLRKDIEARLRNLIAPEQMADVMHKVLSDYKGLHLVSARNLPVGPLKMDQTEEASNKVSNDPDGNDQAVIFAHGFELVLSGSYFQTLKFLQRLEQMSGFYWRALDYEVVDYPKAKITVQINTLSLEEDWIGV